VESTQENLEIVRRGVAAIAAGDWQGVFESWDAQIEWDFEREAVLSGIYRGRDDVRAALLSFMTEWEDFTLEVEDLTAADDGRVVLLVHLNGRGRQSGAPLDFQETLIWTIRGGRVVHVKEYFDRTEALAAAGLPE
jgi:ketosteroid isomerase-like protein